MINELRKTKNSVHVGLEDGSVYYVPIELYPDGEQPESYYIENGIPHSISFELLIKELVADKAHEIQADLYSVGIHTLDDVIANRKLVNDVLRKYISTDVIIKVSKKGDD